MDYRSAWETLRWAGNQAARSNPWLGVPAIMGKPIVEAGLAGLGWGAGATKAAASGHQVDPGPSLYNMVNIYGLGGPAGGLTSGGMKAAPWFSALGRAVEAAPLKQAPGQQWAGTLKNVPGVKQEELDWVGVPEWLASQPGPVTKQQLSDYIKANQVDVQEVVKGDKLVKDETLLRRYRELGSQLESLHGQGVPANDPRVVAGLQQRRHMQEQLAANEAMGVEGGSKFSHLQLPGGENYRELLLTLPRLPKDPKSKGGKFRVPPAHAYGDDASDVNRLAHVRFNDRVDASGKKTLFLEEIQSDWHQKGRKEGYKEGIPFINFNAWRRDRGIGEAEGTRLWREQSGPKWQEWESFRDRMVDDLSKVPDAPFKTSWPELALKRMIKWAADNGYDQIAWTPGMVQGERYNLSKQIDTIVANKTSDGDFHLRIKPKNSGEEISRRLPEKDLEDTVGKEMADKIRKDATEPFKHTVYSGLDLQVGGEGMKAFYDKMLVNTANKLGKKYGAKVGVTKIGGGKPLSKAERSELDFLHDQDGLSARDRARYSALNQRHEQPEQEVWSLPITGAMRKEVGEKGMPLFTGGSGSSLASILTQALNGGSGEESLGDVLGKALKR